MISILFRLIKMDGKDRYQNWSTRDKLVSLMMLSPRILRGWWLKLFLRKSNGLILVGKGTKCFNLSHVTAGRNFLIDDYCELNGLSDQGLNFGNNVTLGKFSLIRPTNQYGGKKGSGLKVGDNSNIGPYCYIGCSGYIEIGDNVMMSPRVSLFAENHNFETTEIPMKEQGVTRETIIIEDDCWIASNSTILAGVTVGSGSIIAAGSVVTKSVPSYSVVAGNPARVIKTRK